MKKKLLWGTICALLILVTISAPVAADPNDEEVYNPVLKIGLYYDSEALPAANLQNLSGQDTGYEIGYWTDAREFVSLYSIDERSKLTVLKDRNMWVTSGSVYYDVLPSSYAYSIGAYHWQVDELYDSLSAAHEVIDWVRELGYVSYPVCVKGGYRVRVGEYLSEERAKEAYNQIVEDSGLELVLRAPSSTGYVVTVTGTDQILCGFDYLGTPLGIRPHSTLTWFKQVKYYGGFEYNRVTGNNMNVINVIDLDHYIRGVIPMEVSSSWPAEALKTQAVCAKCYAYNSIGKHSKKGFDLCDTDDCQVYGGTNQATSATDAAVDAVSGVYVTYQDKVCITYFHSSSGGHTEDCKNIWGTDLPYLKGVEDTYLTVFNPFSYTLTLDQITTILQSKGYTSKKVTDIYVSKYSDYGNVLALTFTEAGGTSRTLTGDRARTALNYTGFSKAIRIGSHRYTISHGGDVYVNGEKTAADTELYVIGADGTPTAVKLTPQQTYVCTASGTQALNIGSDDGYVISGTGSGHNIGMSQWGAYAMAKQGFSYEEILHFYFTDVTVGLYNPQK